MRATPEARFWAKVKKTPTCWEWTGAKANYGYGVFGRGARGQGNHRAHVFSWELHNNACVMPDIKVCHSCDNPSCVNPAHLWLGTQTDNMRDCVHKGRHSPPPMHTGTHYFNGRKR